MADAKRIIAVCSCEDTMPLDEHAISRGCKDGDIRLARHLCRSEFSIFQAMLGEGRPLTVGCTQEAPLFDEAASETGFDEIWLSPMCGKWRDGLPRPAEQARKWPRSWQQPPWKPRPRLSFR